MKKTNKSAFTLVELIVVITILAILGTIAFISLQGYSSSARNSRRISDVNNIKTSLELFNVNTGIYPLPDSFQPISYGGDELWYQGVIGDNVTKNLSKNLSEKPTDPLYEIEYTYSITNTKKEYELLAFYEGNIAQNQILTQTNASTNVTPKILGNYNQLYVKSANYIVPTPSIINAEVNGTGMILNENNIKSQILSEGENILNVNISGIETQTGKLEITLSIYTGSITKESTSTGKILAIEKIQQAYSGTILSNNGIYKYILGKTSNEEKLGLAETVLLNNNFKFTTNDEGGVQLVLVNGECGSDDGQVLIAEPTNKCTTGTSTGLTDGGVGGLYEWDCKGENGGITYSCDANHIVLNNGNDSYTKLLLHMDGSDNGTTFTDSSSLNKSITQNSVLTKTGTKKFGTASAYFGGTSSYLTVADSEDWNFGAGDFTIDGWVNLTESKTHFIAMYHDMVTLNGWVIIINPSNQLTFISEITPDNPQPSWDIGVTTTNTVPLNTWTHIAIVRNGTLLKIYINGVESGNFNIGTNSLIDSPSPLYIGKGADYTKGYIDEFRISKGIARRTSNFTPYVFPYGN